MSSLWTPSGEHRVPRDADRQATPATEAPTDAGPPDEGDDADIEDREAEEALRAELNEARRRVAEAPAAQVVANHAMGLFELAAIHLSQEPPNLGEATLAIDFEEGLQIERTVDAIALSAREGRWVEVGGR